MIERIVVVGGGSKIAFECARVWAARGAWVSLLARDAQKLEEALGDLRARSPHPERVSGEAMELVEQTGREAALSRASARMSGLDAALIAYGSLPDQAGCERDLAQAEEAWQVNGASCASWAMALANHFERQGSGALAMISSVAGERGRAKNYVYGAAKAMLSHLMAGLRIRMNKFGGRALDIRPGFVKTPMTAGLAQGALFAEAKSVAAVIVAAMDEKDGVVYAPGFWRWIMLVLKTLPYAIFKRLPI